MVMRVIGVQMLWIVVRARTAPMTNASRRMLGAGGDKTPVTPSMAMMGRLVMRMGIMEKRKPDALFLRHARGREQGEHAEQ